MKKHILSAHIVFMVLFLSACGGGSKTSFHTDGGDTLRLRHASLLSVVRFEDYTQVSIRNPWDTLKTLHTYLLIDKHASRPGCLPEGTVVPVPLSRVLVYSSVHCALMEELGALPALKGVCDLPYINLASVQEACRRGEIADAGSSMNPDMEQVIDLHPDGILLSPFENSGGYGRIEKLGVPIIECADYMETSALGRAEWMRFYGMLFGKEAQANSLFTHIEQAYLSLKEQAAATTRRPTVISELKNGQAWYVPGGNSTTGKLFADAGAEYVFAGLPQSGSVALSFETVFDRGQHADFWLIKYNQKQDKTYTELQKDYGPYAHFGAFKNRHVYGCNTHRIRFYEESPFHPETVLKDFIKIFHPELLEGYVPKYFRNLAE